MEATSVVVTATSPVVSLLLVMVVVVVVVVAVVVVVPSRLASNDNATAATGATSHARVHHHVHHHHVHHHHAHHHAAAAHALSGRWVLITVALLSVRVRLLNDCYSGSSTGLAANDGLRDVLRREMDVTSWHSHVIEFKPLLRTANSREARHRHLAATNVLRADLISVEDGDFDHVVHVNDFPLEHLHHPDGVSATANDDLRSLFAVHDLHSHEWVHSFEETSVIVLQVCLFQVKLQLAEQTTHHRLLANLGVCLHRSATHRRTTHWGSRHSLIHGVHVGLDRCGGRHN